MPDMFHCTNYSPISFLLTFWTIQHEPFSVYYSTVAVLFSEECFKNYIIDRMEIGKLYFRSRITGPCLVVCRGASKGEGLGNQFLGNIRNVGAACRGVMWMVVEALALEADSGCILSGTDLNQSTSSLVDRTFTALPQQDVRCHRACHSMLWWRGCWKLRAFFGSPGYLTWGILLFSALSCNFNLFP